MASDNGSGGVGLPGLVIAALIAAVFGYFLIGERLGLRNSVSTADVRVEAARVPIPLPEPKPRQRK